MPRTREESIATYSSNSLALFNSLSPKCIDDVFDSPAISLAEIRHKVENGRDRVKSFLAYVILDVLKMFNIGKNADEQQISGAIDMILEDFYYFKMDDIKLIVGMAKRGKFGEIYGRIDGQTIYSWFEKYDSMRTEAAIAHTLRKHNEVTGSEKSSRDIFTVAAQNKFAGNPF